ncbi:FecCD family ABC transporter permease [Algiphilus aromaticivorans]|uniref:FecCD family ABC transporter permease n=1 Tax=Algiphilus aromaticivorans TaxID=382454 RepID=UPI0005C206B5|nr:iron ABC transporter permease [Algiphilus aromaticivorans]
MEAGLRRLPAGAGLGALGLALVVVAAAGLAIGPVAVGLSELLPALFGSGEGQAGFVVQELRLPRIALGALVGAALAVSGAILQGLFRNPLADPALIGISAGAALGAVTVIVLGERVMASFGLGVSPLLMPAAAFIGALVATLAVWRIATRGGNTSVAKLLLAGIAINAIASAGTGILTFLADDTQLRTLTFWTMGSLAHAGWAEIRLLAPWMLALACAAPWLARPLNAMLLGEAVAGHLGYPAHRMKQAAVLVCALAVGASVAMTGLIGFVGLVAPHIVRLMGGVDHRWLLPASALLGATLLIAADALARVIVAPAELPIGLVTSLIGGPFFLMLLMRQQFAE